MDSNHYYSTEFTVGSSLYDDLYRVVPHIAATLHMSGPNDDREPVGTLLAWLIRGGLAINEGIDIFEACDAASAEAANIAYHCYGEDQCLREDILGRETAFNDLLFVDRVQVNPEHRGQQLGLRLVCSLIDIYGGGCAALIGKPFPLQFEGKQTDQNQSELEDAKRKVESYWAQLGHRRLAETVFYITDLESFSLKLKSL